MVISNPNLNEIFTEKNLDSSLFLFVVFQHLYNLKKAGDHMDPKEIKIEFCKYKISKFEIRIPGEEESFVVDDAHRGNWSIEKDFENYVFPYLEFRCIVPDVIYRKVMQTSEDVYVDLKIEYAYFDDMYEMDPTDALYMYNTLLDARFYAFIANKSPKMTDAMYGETIKDIDNEDGTYTQYSYDNAKSLVMGLYRFEHIFRTNCTLNAILANVTTADAVTYMLQRSSVDTILMSPSDNPTVYDQLVIPPLHIPHGLLRTINTYGLHSAGTILFFDYDRIYVIDKKLGATAWANNEVTTVYLTSFPATSDQSVMKSGFFENNVEKYWVINIVGNSISIENEAMYDDQLVGGNILAIDSNTGETTRVFSDITVSKSSPIYSNMVNRVVIQDTGSSSTLQGAKTEVEQNQNMLNVTVENINIKALSPNKDFIFTTDNTKYQEYTGHYRIRNMSAVFTKESELYSCMCTATFVGGKATLS